MPMNPAAPERIAPIAKPRHQPPEQPSEDEENHDADNAVWSYWRSDTPAPCAAAAISHLALPAFACITDQSPAIYDRKQTADDDQSQSCRKDQNLDWISPGTPHPGSKSRGYSQIPQLTQRLTSAPRQLGNACGDGQPRFARSQGQPNQQGPGRQQARNQDLVDGDPTERRQNLTGGK